MALTIRATWLRVFLAAGALLAIGSLSIIGCHAQNNHGAKVGTVPMARYPIAGATGQAAAVLGDIPLVGNDLWIIERDTSKIDLDVLNYPEDWGQRLPISRCGELVLRPAGEPSAPATLRHTDVKASVVGAISTVQVTQQFTNPYAAKIEAVYVFPLPQDSAVNDFVMTIGDRTIRGVIRDKEEAQQIYTAARAQGYTASLLSQDRPNIFVQSVANIEPGKSVDVTIRYFGSLQYSDGAFEFVFPMVVAPRYNPATHSRASSAPPSQPEYLPTEQRSGTDVTLSVDIEAGMPIGKISSISHVITTDRTGPTSARVKLSELDAIPNKDFVLRYELAQNTLESGVIATRDEHGGTFALLIVPPNDQSALRRSPVELVFVLDASGSMNGIPIEQAKQAIERGMKRLEPGDTFQIVNFSNDSSALGAMPLDATPANIRRGQEYLSKIQSEGGTEMLRGLRASLDFPHDPRRLRFVVFLTDGQIGNEADILYATQDKIRGSRIFSIGVGSSPNRFLMDSMARMGRGFSEYLSDTDSAAAVMDAFFDRISHPALTDISIGGGAAITPARIPDIFAGRPVMVFGRFEGEVPSTMYISGRVGDRTMRLEAPVTLAPDALSRAALTPMWARTRIQEIAEQSVWDSKTDAYSAIRSLALTHGLVSSATSFIAVDASRRTDGEFGVTVPVQVPMPQGQRYETAAERR